MADDYIQDGLLYCGKCNTAKQAKMDWFGRDRLLTCLCSCELEKQKAEEQEQRNKEREWRIESMRSSGIQDKLLRSSRFKNATKTENIEACYKYAKKWEKAKEQNIGLLMWGAKGTGKTFLASCIANHLIDQDIPVLMTSFPRILNSGFDKTELVERINKTPLVIIDDLGAERQSEYALETVFYVIDERYKAKKPLIVTTNMHLSEIKKGAEGKDVAYARIYDRILEMCVPMCFNGDSIRHKIRATKINSAREIMT